MHALYPDELNINRLHKLSDRQKKNLLFQFYLWAGVTGAILLFLLLMIFFQVYFRIGFSEFVVLYFLVISALLFAIHKVMPYKNDLRESKVKMVAGKLYKYSRTVGKVPTGYCIVGIEHLSFEVSPVIFDSLDQGEEYRIYYTPESKMLLNVERR